jgi:hypothetical protein
LALTVVAESAPAQENPVDPAGSSPPVDEAGSETGLEAIRFPVQLEGRWLAGEEADEFEVLLELVEGDWVGTAYDLEATDDRPEEAAYTFTLVARDATHYRLRMAPDDLTRDVHFVVQDADHALLWEAGDDHLAVARRIGEMPEWLLGSWRAERDRERAGPARAVEFASDRAVIDEESGSHSCRLYPLASPGPTADLAIAYRTVEPELFHVQRLPDESLLFWRHGDDDFLVLYRGEARPAWLSWPSP